MSDAAKDLLHAWLLRQLDAERGAWLDTQLAALREDPSDAALDLALGMAPRKLGKAALALSADDELRASIGSASPRPVLVIAPRGEADTFPERVAAAAEPIDDVRGTAAYRRHALRVMTARALERTLVA